MSPAQNNPQNVLSRLQKRLFALLAQNAKSPFQSAALICEDTDLGELGITSIDFLEFVLSVEEEFGLTILDTIAPNDLPQTLRVWQQLVSARLDQAA